MTTFQKTFTDPQGATHTDAVILITRAEIRKDSGNSYEINYKHTDQEPQLINSAVTFLSYEVFYWINQEAKEANLEPYKLRNTVEFMEDFSFSNLGPEYDGLTAIQAAKKHLIENTLP